MDIKRINKNRRGCERHLMRPCEPKNTGIMKDDDKKTNKGVLQTTDSAPYRCVDAEAVTLDVGVLCLK